MERKKVIEELSRQINASSRKMREADTKPTSAELSALAKLTEAYTALIQVNDEDELDITHKLKNGLGYEHAQGWNKIQINNDNDEDK